MKKTVQILISLLIFTSCKNDDMIVPDPEEENLTFISAVDISKYPEISNTNQIFYDLDENQKDFLTLLKEKGINTIRLRLWVKFSKRTLWI